MMRMVNYRSTYTSTTRMIPESELGPGCIACQDTETGERFYTPLTQSMLDFGPDKHSEKDINDGFGPRIKAIREALAEVYPITQKQWVKGFCTDTDPDNEVAIWECIAKVYQKVTSNGKYSREQQAEIFRVLMCACNTAGPEAALATLEVDKLTEQDVVEILILYYALRRG